MDPATRALAARAMYRPWDDRSLRQDADRAIATTLRFREVAVKKLALDKRSDYLARVVRPDDALASSLLTALHLSERQAMLAAFLDNLGIPQKDGLIEQDHDLGAPKPESLSRAAKQLYDGFPAAEVDLYLASLVSMDREAWGGLVGVIRDLRCRPQRS